jgi:hypothetical protein
MERQAILSSGCEMSIQPAGSIPASLLRAALRGLSRASSGEE